MRLLTAVKCILYLQVTVVIPGGLASFRMFFNLCIWQRQEQAMMLMLLHSFGLNHIIGGVVDKDAVNDDSTTLGRSIQSADALVILGIGPETLLNDTSHQHL
jgi:hypothetical protein